MKKQSPEYGIAIWNHLVEAHKAFALASQKFFTLGEERITLMRNALRGADKNTAIYMLNYLDVSELKALFNDIVFLASFSHGGIKTIRQVILAMPRKWVLEKIRESAEPLLKVGTHEEYRRFLELYMELDLQFAFELAQRATRQPDIDIIEVGEDFLSKLNSVDG